MSPQCRRGLITFDCYESATKAIAYTNRTSYRGRVLKVNVHDPASRQSHNEDPKANIYVANLPPHWNQLQLEQHFAGPNGLRQVDAARILRDSNGKSRQVAFVQFKSVQEAHDAIEENKGKPFYPGGAPSIVRFARDEQPSRSNTSNTQLGSISSLCSLEHSEGEGRSSYCSSVNISSSSPSHVDYNTSPPQISSSIFNPDGVVNHNNHNINNIPPQLFHNNDYNSPKHYNNTLISASERGSPPLSTQSTHRTLLHDSRTHSATDDIITTAQYHQQLSQLQAHYNNNTNQQQHQYQHQHLQMYNNNNNNTNNFPFSNHKMLLNSPSPVLPISNRPSNDPLFHTEKTTRQGSYDDLFTINIEQNKAAHHHHGHHNGHQHQHNHQYSHQNQQYSHHQGHIQHNTNHNKNDNNNNNHSNTHNISNSHVGNYSSNQQPTNGLYFSGNDNNYSQNDHYSQYFNENNFGDNNKKNNNGNNSGEIDHNNHQQGNNHHIRHNDHNNNNHNNGNHDNHINHNSHHHNIKQQPSQNYKSELIHNNNNNNNNNGRINNIPNGNSNEIIYHNNRNGSNNNNHSNNNHSINNQSHNIHNNPLNYSYLNNDINLQNQPVNNLAYINPSAYRYNYNDNNKQPYYTNNYQQ
jgi:hypothetical protein